MQSRYRITGGGHETGIVDEDVNAAGLGLDGSNGRGDGGGGADIEGKKGDSVMWRWRKRGERSLAIGGGAGAKVNVVRSAFCGGGRGEGAEECSDDFEADAAIST